MGTASCNQQHAPSQWACGLLNLYFSFPGPEKPSTKKSPVTPKDNGKNYKILHFIVVNHYD